MKRSPGNKLWFKYALSILILSGTTSFGQTKPIPKNIVNKDVMFAIEIHDSVSEPFTYPALGVGANFWYKFIPENDTTLSFDIVPYDPNQDYGYELYKCEHADCSTDIKDKKINPVRSCASINHGKYSSSGLSPVASFSNIASGPGFPYAATLPVRAGDTYYLKVTYGNCCKESCKSCNSLQRGFKLYLYNLWPKKPKRLITKTPVKPKEIILENVLFETNKSILLKQSYAPLDTLVRQLTLQKTMAIDIKGHTDNTGDEAKNQDLSEKRAEAVYNYLVSKGIAKTRLTYNGMGDKEPIATNDTEEGRKKNRRVAFVIVTK